MSKDIKVKIINLPPVSNVKRNLTPLEAESIAKDERAQKRHRILKNVVSAAKKTMNSTNPVSAIGKLVKDVSALTKKAAAKAKVREMKRREDFRKVIMQEKLDQAIRNNDLQYLQKVDKENNKKQ